MSPFYDEARRLISESVKRGLRGMRGRSKRHDGAERPEAPSGTTSFESLESRLMLAADITFTGMVFMDMDGNGTYDAGTDSPLSGVMVYLDNGASADQPDATDAIAITAADGTYSITDSIEDGDYQLRHVPPMGLMPTSEEAAVTVAAGTATTYANNDFVDVVPSFIDGLAWSDYDGDGIQDADETGVWGTTVELRKASDDSLVDTTTSEEDGMWEFEYVLPGSYYVTFSGTGYEPTLKDQGSDDMLDSDADPTTGQTDAFTVGGDGMPVDDIAVGLVRTGSIHGRVILPADGMMGGGQDDEGMPYNPALAGWVVFLDTNQDGALSAGESTTATGSDGTYTFGTLGDDTYHVRLSLQSGWEMETGSSNPVDVTTPGEEVADFTLDRINVAPDLDLDADDSSTATGRDYATTYTEGGSTVTVADGDALVSDEVGMLASMTISITSGTFSEGDLLDADVSGTPVTKSYDGTTGVLTLTGPGTLTNFTSILRSVTYQHAGAAPGATKTLEVVINDGEADSATATTTITITTDNDAAPTFVDGATFELPPVAEDTADPAGTTVDALLDDSGSYLYEDLDGDVCGIAITAIDNTNGTWQYKIGAGAWTAIPTDVADATALLLAETDSVRFVPTADYAGTVADGLTFRLWDQSDGESAGTQVDTSTNGAQTAYSTATASADINITADNDAPVVQLGDSANDFTATWTEDAGATNITHANATITDVDSANLASMTVSITAELDPNGDYDVLQADTAGTPIVASYDATTGVLSLTGSATVAQYQQVLRSVTFSNTSDTPHPNARTIEVVVNDGSADSTTRSCTMNVTTTNDVPVLNLDPNNTSGARPNYEVDFTEGGGPVGIVAGDAALADPDDINVASMTVTLVNKKTGDALDGTAAGTIVKTAYDSGTGILAFSGSESTANYMTTLQSLTFTNSEDIPDTTPREIQIVVNDGTGNSAIYTSTVNVVEDNDLPVVQIGDGALDNTAAYTEDSGTPVAIAHANSTITDADDTELASMTITIATGEYESGDTLTVDTDLSGTNITWTYDTPANPGEGPATLTLTGSDTPANYLIALKAVKYSNDQDPTDSSTRAITVVVNDGVGDSAAATCTVTLTAANDGPLVTVDSTAAHFEEGDSAVPLAPMVTVENFDSAWSDGTLVIDFDPDGTTNDTLALDDSLSTDLSLAGTTLSSTAAGGEIATLSAASINGTETLTITFDGAQKASVTDAIVQDILQSLTYVNASENPTAGDRTITVTPTDDGGAGAAATATVTVVADNDAPALAIGDAGATSNAVTWTEGTPIAIVHTNATLTDADDTTLDELRAWITNPQPGDVLAATEGATGLTATWDAATYTLTITGDQAVANYLTILKTITFDSTDDTPDTTARTINIAVHDGNDGWAGPQTATVSITASNDAPALSLDADDSSGAGSGNYATTWDEADDPVALVDTDATVGDPDDSDWGTGTLEAQITANNEAGDHLKIVQTDRVTLSGTDISVDGAQVAATTAVEVDNGAAMTITFAAGASDGDVLAIMHALRYYFDGANPTANDRTVTLTLTDENTGGDESATVKTTTVTVTAGENDKPTVGGTVNAGGWTEDGGAVAITSTDAAVADVDGDGIVSATITITDYMAGDTLAVTPVGGISAGGG